MFSLPRLCALTLALTLALSTLASADTARPRVYGGAVITAADAPWQVFLRTADNSICGGSIIDPTHVVSAAHCADHDGTTAPVPASSFTVMAGFTDVSTYAPGQPAPAGTQVVGVASYRIHPYYDNAMKIDDVMVLTLATPLNLNASPNVKAIPMAPAGTEIAGGTALRVTGFGRSSPSPPDGKLRSLVITAQSDDDCLLPAQNSSMIICAGAGPGQSSCSGDSGGPLTLADGPPALVGVVSYGRVEGCGTGTAGYTDVTTPEVRAFIEGNDAPPKAPRHQAPAVLSGIAVQGSPLSCVPGTWDGAPTYTYIFKAEGIGPLQSGPTPTYVPGAQDLGRAITCVVRAANGGGTSTARSGTSPAIAPDTVKPIGRLQRWSCRGRTCRFTLLARDPNSHGAVSVTGSARYRGRGHRLKVKSIGSGRFSVVAKRLPRRAKVRFTFRVYDAVGNRRTISRRPTVRIRSARR